MPSIDKSQNFSYLTVPILIPPPIPHSKHSSKKVAYVFPRGRGKRFSHSFITHMRIRHSFQNQEPENPRYIQKLGYSLLQLSGVLILAWLIYESVLGLRIF